MPKGLRKFLGFLAFVVVFGGLIVLATHLSGAAAVVTWLIWLVLLLATIALGYSAKPNLNLDDAARQALIAWQVAHPDRKPGWTSESVPARSSRYDQARPDHDLVSRFSGNPPFGYDTKGGSEAQPTFVAVSTVAGLRVLVLEQGRRDAKTPEVVGERITAVSLDIARPCHRLSIYRRSGYQRAAWYRTWRFRTGDPAFDALFRVDTDSPTEARQLLPPPVTAFLAADPRTPHLGITLEGRALTVWLANRFDVVAVPPMIDLLVELSRRLPIR